MDIYNEPIGIWTTYFLFDVLHIYQVFHNSQIVHVHGIFIQINYINIRKTIWTER